ncbi:MAG: putative toxin-antitoxin system toxin component, PIN family [Candidatus Aenigmatarchaeota archaeon]
MTIKLVLDTNVFVSGFLWEGNESEAIRNIERKEAMNFINPEILSEIEDVISRDKFKDMLAKHNLTADEIIEKIISLSHIVIGRKLEENVVKSDPKDDKFIECAINSDVDYIVSGDKHLLELKEYENIKIITAKEFVDIVEKSSKN